MRRTIFILVLLSISLVHARIFTARASEEHDSSCMIGYSCNDAQQCGAPAYGNRARVDECAPLKNVFGNDDRVLVTSTDYPWRAIGKLSMGCTGTLVARDLVLTAAHCVIDPNTNYLITSQIYFYPNMINGKWSHRARAVHVWWGTNKPDTYREDDWALLRLDTKLGDTQGWLGIRTISIDTMKNTAGTLVGYSSNFQNSQTAGAHINCHVIKQLRPKFFLHDCDNGRGASGGPIFAYWNNQPSIYALNVAEYRNDGDTSLHLPNYTDKNANIAIWSSELANKIIELSHS